MPDFDFDENRSAWLLLASFSGFGSRTLFKLKQRYRDGVEALQVPFPELEAMGHGVDVIERFVEFRRDFDAEQTVQRLEKDGLRFLLIDEEDYPPLLRHISDPPQALFVRGAFPDPDVTAVSIVGTRSCTGYGRKVTDEFARGLSAAGLTIVSGLALGIDTVAHTAALEMGGACIAVLGSGADDGALYPRSNVRLAHSIIENGGAVISEFPPGTDSFKHHFPLRNRIIAGLSRATLVTEAALKSGSLITAHLALSYNRDVFAIPGPITSIQSEGANRLIAQGAMLCSTPQDVLDALHTPGLECVPSLRLTDLPTEDRKLIDALDEPQRINDLSRVLKTNILELQQRITALEIKGYVEMQSGQLIARTRLISSSAD